LLLPCLASVALIVKLGVLRGETIQGPLRVRDDESPTLLCVIVFAAMIGAGVVGQFSRSLFQTGERGTLLMGAILSGVIFFLLLGLNVATRVNALQSLGLHPRQFLSG